MSSAITVTLIGKKKTDISDQLISLYTEYELNKVPEAKLTLSTGNFSDRKYPLFEEADFQLGANITINIRYESSGSSDKSIFKGIVTNISFEVLEGLPIMTLGVSDPAFRLISSVNTTFYNKKNDKQIIETILTSQTGISLAKTSSSLTSYSFFQFIKKQQSDWFFILERAAAHGLYIQMNNGAMNILELTDTTGEFTLDIGVDEIVNIELKKDVIPLNQNITLGYWDVKQNKIMTVQKQNTDEVAKLVKASNGEYVFLGITNKKEAQGMLQNISVSQQQSALKGYVQIPGNNGITLMQKLKLSSLPTAYNGTYTISKVVQNVRHGTWTTKIGVGNTNLPILNSFQVDDHISSAIKSIETATVLKWEKDPENLGRIPVKILAFGADKYWAYPGQVSAGKKQSSYLLPEEGELVIIGFTHNNYSQGIILTSSYLSSNQPPSPFKLSDTTPVGFLSKKGLKLIFDDSKKDINISSSDANKINLNDSNGIILKSKKDFSSTSSGKSEIKASSTVTVKGTTINLN